MLVKLSTSYCLARIVGAALLLGFFMSLGVAHFDNIPENLSIALALLLGFMSLGVNHFITRLTV